MLAESCRRILDELNPDDVVLDVGAGFRPFTRADWVLDLLPYEARAPAGRDGPGEERFTEQTWIQRDVCDRQPWPFADGDIDFAICSHTLEDVRDPIWVCSELVRVARAGYIEVPSRLEEQSYGVHGPWVGWSHHHWLVDVSASHIQFVFKHHVLHARDSDHFPAGFRDALTPEQRVQTLWWQDRFGFAEVVMTSAHEVDRYLADFVHANRHLVPTHRGRRTPRRLVTRLLRRY